MCWSPIPRSPTPWFAPPSAPIIIGALVGQTNIVFFDAAGQQIAAYDIAVTRDLNGVRAALKQSMRIRTSRSRASATA